MSIDSELNAPECPDATLVTSVEDDPTHAASLGATVGVVDRVGVSELEGAFDGDGE